MSLQGMPIEQLMEKLGRSGVTVILKVDDERMVKGGEPWTLVMSGPGLGPEGFIRAESSSLSDCLEQGFTRLFSRPGDWEWIAEIS
ncbi:hypothetical protein AB0O64_14775 [Streptomyces sp. NPDC088341]|uniref:hypothetical protein n=1 Tax=Streptomyces sp. NPDC088341 TaxID=3154870 RepID=UPI00342C12A9